MSIDGLPRSAKLQQFKVVHNTIWRSDYGFFFICLLFKSSSKCLIRITLRTDFNLPIFRLFFEHAYWVGRGLTVIFTS